jgi:RNA polymerase sigma factor (sigma-70 family)
MTPAEHRLFLARDQEIAEVVVRRTGRIALPLATAVLGDRDAAADVAQDVALDVLRGLRKLREPERFNAWVRRIAVRHALRAARRRRLELPLDSVPERGTAASAVLRAELREALAELSPRQRAALALRYVHGLSDAEIAAALGCRPGTASSLLTRARYALATLEGGP